MVAYFIGKIYQKSIKLFSTKFKHDAKAKGCLLFLKYVLIFLVYPFSFNPDIFVKRICIIINIMGYYQDCPIHLAHMPHKAVYGNLIHSRKRLIQQKYWLFTAKHTQHGYNLFLSSAQILYIRILLNMTDYLLWKIFLISIKIFQTIGAINADIILI